MQIDPYRKMGTLLTFSQVHIRLVLRVPGCLAATATTSLPSRSRGASRLVITVSQTASTLCRTDPLRPSIPHSHPGVPFRTSKTLLCHRGYLHQTHFELPPYHATDPYSCPILASTLPPLAKTPGSGPHDTSGHSLLRNRHRASDPCWTQLAVVHL